jgi:hypothetical protein
MGGLQIGYVNAPANFLAEVPVFHDPFEPALIVSQKNIIANPGNAPPLFNGGSLFFVANGTYLIKYSLLKVKSSHGN